MAENEVMLGVVARMIDDGVLGPAWECDICGRVLAFQSVMITHLFMDHRVQMLTPEGTTMKGRGAK